MKYYYIKSRIVKNAYFDYCEKRLISLEKTIAVTSFRRSNLTTLHY